MAALLPWRRNKLVLVEGPSSLSSSSSSSSSSGVHGEGPGKVKALGLALGYCSLLAHLVSACPAGLWPPGPPPRERLLGRIFRRRRRTVELNGLEPVYSAWYLGNAITLQAQGGAEEAVERIWAKSQGGARSSPMRLALGPHGLRLSPAESPPGGRRPSHAYLLHRITYCGPDRRRPRILAWVYRHQVKHKAVVLRCHAVLLSRAEKAQAVSRRLGQACRSAFEDFRRLKRQDDARHRQRQLLGEAVLPPVPLRRLLNGKCPYRPPPDRGRGAPRLSAIQEEEEEEEEEKEKREKKREEGRLPPNSSNGPSAIHKVGRMQAIFGANGSLSTAAAAVAGTVAARFSLSPTESPKETACAASAVAARLSLGAADGAPAGKLAQGPERSEVLSLARDLHFCTLRGSLPQGDPLCPWEDHRGTPLCSRCQRLGSRCQILPREREEGGGRVGWQALV